jgi:hypothetical protein
MEIVEKFLNTVLSILPTSPFTQFIPAIASNKFIGWLNYFVPISEFITIGTAWLGAVGVFYLWMIILRWIRAIE